MDLKEKKCAPCEGGAPTLTPDQVLELMSEVAGWEVFDRTQLERSFKFEDFKKALAFINKVGELAEQENHHPDILLHGWNKVTLTLSTHAIGGLSENDFILAAKINEKL